MKDFALHGSVTLLYMSFLGFIYVLEISTTFRYMGFSEISGLSNVFIIAIISIFLSSALSTKADVRNLLLVFFHYVFFIPSLIISTTLISPGHYLIVLLISAGLIVISANIPIRSARIASLSQKHFFIIVFSFLFIQVVLLAAYGGMRNFSLNIFTVYDFRRDVAADMPGIFAYFISGVSKVVAPITLALAIYFRSSALAVLSMSLTVWMFGMTHHKSVLFLPLMVGALYYMLLSKRAFAFIMIGLISVTCFSLAEVLLKFLFSSQEPALFTGIFLRRVLFIPPLLDAIYVGYFENMPKFYWSTSRLGLGLSQNPYELTAPFLIGLEAFSREGMSANTGVIGSGYANAGLVGVIIYSIILGFVVGILQAFGRAIGHELVFAGSLSVVFSVLTSTDLTTAFLTHGLIFLFLLLVIFPRRRRFAPTPA